MRPIPMLQVVVWIALGVIPAAGAQTGGLSTAGLEHATDLRPRVSPSVGAASAGLGAADWNAIRKAHDASQELASAAGGAQLAYLKASNTEAEDYFGDSVSVSGDTVVVGALYEDSSTTGVNGDDSIDGSNLSGAAYVFVRTGTGWSQQAYLKASNTGPEDRFGTSVSVSGDTIVVGAPFEDSNGSNAGAAYVFVRSGTTWSQQAFLKASNAESADQFGSVVAVSGDTLAVGAGYEFSAASGVNGDQSDNSLEGAGAAYIFVRNGTTWTQQAYLKASNPDMQDGFGHSLALSETGDTVVVGSWLEDSNATGVNGDQGNNGAMNSGAAYVFVRSGVTWSQQAFLKASNTAAQDIFGWSLSATGDTVVVGATGEDSNATGVNSHQFNNSAPFAGAVYVFVRSGTAWQQQAYLKASNTESADNFGNSVCASGETIVVGAPREDSRAMGVNGNQNDNTAFNSGAAYVFVRDGASWSQHAYLKASNTGDSDVFATSVALSGDTLLAGATGESSGATGVNGDEDSDRASESGAAYLFDLDLDAWTDLGSGLVGTSGAPLLVGSGTLEANSANQLDLTHANPSSAATLVFGLSQLGAPFKGGTLVPTPLLLVPLGTDAAGALSLPFTWPAGAPANTQIYFQFWVADTFAVSGLSASNGLVGLTP